MSAVDGFGPGDRSDTLRKAFDHAFAAYNSPRDRYFDDHDYIVKLRTEITACFGLLQKLVHGEKVEAFTTKHYVSEERPIIKGNGFDGLEIGADREEAEKFVEWLNRRIL